MTERRRQGLCYNCQYIRGHKCPRLFYLEVADPNDEIPNLLDDPLPAKEDESFIYLNAITGIHGKDTMQVCVTLGTHEFTVLLDSGSTTNFISCAASTCSHLRFQSGNGVYVRVTNGDKVYCRGLARDVVIHIGQEEFIISCIAIPWTATTWCSVCRSCARSCRFFGTSTICAWPFGTMAVGCSGRA
jgi:hypothetical protein